MLPVTEKNDLGTVNQRLQTWMVYPLKCKVISRYNLTCSVWFRNVYNKYDGNIYTSKTCCALCIRK